MVRANTPILISYSLCPLIASTSHYTTVLDLAMKAKHSLRIGTADIKDL